MTQAERTVGVLLNEEDAEELIRDVDFDPTAGGNMIALHSLDLIKSELNDLTQAVIRRTAEIAPVSWLTVESFSRIRRPSWRN